MAFPLQCVFVVASPPNLQDDTSQMIRPQCTLGGVELGNLEDGHD